ncbi:MAG TPA: hypothetical protein VJZ76_24615 [Thermoanaerobaculia bacterium]|nr:hypothetical protein [Thermoanaerobaculia bacterium]
MNDDDVKRLTDAQAETRQHIELARRIMALEGRVADLRARVERLESSTH